MLNDRTTARRILLITMKRTLTLIAALLLTSLHADEPLSGVSSKEETLVGDWSLTLPANEAGWLSVLKDDDHYKAELLWAVGSANPVTDLDVQDGTLSFTRKLKRPLALNEEPAVLYRITAQVEGNALNCRMQPADGGDIVPFEGKRMPTMPMRPDLAKVRFGEPISLFNEHDLAGWHASNPTKKNGWSVREGVLCNDTPKTDFGAYGDYANLRTDADFNDFKLHIEYLLPAEIGGNSGIYLRGLYEVQVTHRESKMQGIHGPGAVFGRITPTKNAGRPAGQWELLDITLVDRHVSVRLNDELVIDNEPVAGPTGGALHADVTASGPIYLQGDHTSVQYRNITLRPLMP
jgi:hypothetical protein